MEPSYFLENRYSPIINFKFTDPSPSYEVDTPDTRFEYDVQHRLARANRLLMAGKFATALAQYEDLRALIARVLRPEIGYVGSFAFDWSSVVVAEMSDALIAKSAAIMQAEPLARTELPDTLSASDIKLPDSIAKSFKLAEGIGLDAGDKRIGALLDQAVVKVNIGDNLKAEKLLNGALKIASDPKVKAAIRHDIAAVQEQQGNRSAAIETLQKANKDLTEAGANDARIEIMSALVGMLARNDQSAAAKKALNELRELGNAVVRVSSGRSVTPIAGITERPGLLRLNNSISNITPSRALTLSESASAPAAATVFARIEVAANIEEAATVPLPLLASTVFAARQTARTFSVLDSKGKAQKVALNDNAAENLKSHFELLRKTSDLQLLTGWVYSPTHTIAYLTHVSQWVIPVAMGDCHAALGSYGAAERDYLQCLDYPYLNEVVEVVTLWVRLADLYVDWGDQLYRQARNDVSRFGAARKKYEQVILVGDEVNDSSPLYSHQRFTKLRARASAIIQNLFIAKVPNTDNPRLALALARARMQIRKIDAKLNYIGLGVYVPPFSFEYLQNVARYFAQHSAQVEQMYIQFQTSGENEELRVQQMQQQAELADASVELEQRGLDEAESGVDVAQTNRDAALQQLANAQATAADFDAVAGELLELAAIQAWSQAAAVDEDDEVKQTVNGHTYYSSDGKRRSLVLYDLAKQRARITNDLEENRLNREIAAADAYKDLADEQIDQAEARVDVAEQRIVIAQLQKTHAQENLEFLSSKEFTSSMWYDMAREARRIAGRYLDGAIEIATLMEKAYEAETGRDLRKIKFEYGLDKINGLLGSDALLLDIDYFTLDMIRTRSKRAPMRQSLSMADNFPVAFEQLLSSGSAMFETTLEHFERRYPGFYLQKVKQVEVRVIGLNGTEGLHGTLRNIGLSKVRHKNATIENQIYPADVMPLSEYDVRQDAIVFQHDSKDLRLFENNGIATMWRLDLPLSTNQFDLRQILDIQLVIAYDGFFDAGVEVAVVAALPNNGAASSGISLQLYAPDELFFLRANGGCSFAVTPDLFPANQVNQNLTAYRLQVLGAAAAGLNLSVTFKDLGQTHTFTLDADGRASNADFPAPLNRSLFETLEFNVDPAQNPDVNLSAIDDLQMVFEYDFDYRS